MKNDFIMITKAIESEIPWGDLPLDFEDIYLSMGKNYKPDAYTSASIDSLINSLKEFCQPRMYYTFSEAKFSKRNYVIAGDTELHTGPIITPYLNDADQFVIFVVTAGHEFQCYQNEIKKSGDIYKEFLLDSIGTGIAEASVRYLCEKVEQEISTFNYGISFPYSPGYCGWHVSQQQLLFSMLPSNPCGVCLNNSSLMYPIKSVSGIIAIGNNVKKRKYGCELCGKVDCYKNRNKVK